MLDDQIKEPQLATGGAGRVGIEEADERLPVGGDGEKAELDPVERHVAQEIEHGCRAGFVRPVQVLHRDGRGVRESKRYEARFERVATLALEKRGHVRRGRAPIDAGVGIVLLDAVPVKAMGEGEGVRGCHCPRSEIGLRCYASRSELGNERSVWVS